MCVQHSVNLNPLCDVCFSTVVPVPIYASAPTVPARENRTSSLLTTCRAVQDV